MIELLSRQRSTILQFDLDREAAWRLAVQHEASAMTDELIQRAAHTLREHLRPDAHLARTGGDEFVALLPGCSLAEAQSIVERLQQALDAAGVRTSVGSAERKSHRGLADALHRADAAMYADKSARA